MHRRTKTTMIYVTHDQVEAMSLGDRVAVMSAGRLLQVDTPAQTYHSPADTFVAQFIGNSPMNLFPGYIASQRLCGLDRQIDIQVELDNGPVTIGIRPERLSTIQSGPIRVVGTITAIEYLGAEQLVQLAHDRLTFAARLESTHAYREGEHIALHCETADVLLFAQDAVGQFICRASDVAR
jgi:ABC-type sugar transport system ATPase subunit